MTTRPYWLCSWNVLSLPILGSLQYCSATQLGKAAPLPWKRKRIFNSISENFRHLSLLGSNSKTWNDSNNNLRCSQFQTEYSNNTRFDPMLNDLCCTIKPHTKWNCSDDAHDLIQQLKSIFTPAQYYVLKHVQKLLLDACHMLLSFNWRLSIHRHSMTHGSCLTISWAYPKTTPFHHSIGSTLAM